jgi:predicted acyltransferase
MAFVMPRLEQAGTSVFLKKVITRTLLIFGIGLFLNWWPFIRWNSDSELVFKHWVEPDNPSNGIRILGVLPRIALSYFFASIIIYFFKIRGAFVASAIILLGYWFITLALGTTGDPYSFAGYFGTAVDKAVLGVPHMYKGDGVLFEPEGLMSTFPSIVQVIFGYFAGNYIKQKSLNYEMLANLFVIGSVLIFTGFCMDTVFPINKKIWSSSYVLYTSGLAITVLGVFIYLIEFKSVRGAWSKFFDVFGKNPLFIFVLSSALGRLVALFRWVDHLDKNGKPVYTSAFPWFYQHVCKPVSDNLKNGSLLYAICMIIFFWSIVYFLDKKKIYIKV